MSTFRSIRWRLVAGFTLLTLLTVSLLGILVLSLMQRYVAQQENAYLSQNATAIAQQSEPFLVASSPAQELDSLARTAALLGNFRVKILDANEEILVDSAHASTHDYWTWFGPPVDAEGVPRDFVIIEGIQQREMAGEDIAAPPFHRGPMHGEPTDGAPIVEVIIPERHVFERGWPRWREQAERDATSYSIRVTRHGREGWGPRLEFERVPFDVPLDQTLRFSETITITEQDMAIPISDLPLRPNGILNGNIDINPALLQRVMTPIQVGDGIVGYVELSSTPGVALEALIALRRLFLLAGVAVSVVAVGVGLVMSRSLTAPLQALTQATGQMNDGDLTARANVQSHDEIGLLAQGFNRMADALEKNFADLAAERDALRAFIADASHELRTPITALRTFNDLLQDSAAHDPRAQREFLAESGLQLQRLERITENLLNLSRLDGGLIELTSEEVRVDEFLTHVIEMLRPLAIDQDVALTANLPAPTLSIHCDRHQMERAVVNLVENALKFTPIGGHVEVGADQQQGTVQIWVVDDGIGIPAQEQNDIFRRFYRGQNAINGGSGLGLAIVQSVMNVHGGTISLTSTEGAGSRFTLHLLLRNDE